MEGIDGAPLLLLLLRRRGLAAGCRMATYFVFVLPLPNPLGHLSPLLISSEQLLELVTEAQLVSGPSRQLSGSAPVRLAYFRAQYV